jgi:prepilin-type N-terminal cleavage/methylation domain-containing protein
LTFSARLNSQKKTTYSYLISMKLARKNTAFTLVELLVVISIIGILAGIAFPAYTTIQERGRQTQALTYAKQIGTVCKIYAGDYDGRFPTFSDPIGGGNQTFSTANDAFTELIEGGYVSDETLFYIPKSPFCEGIAGINKDDEVDPGENHWAYYVGLTDTDNSSYPLIIDGVESGYSYDETSIWGGKRAIVCYLDMSARVENLTNDGNLEGNYDGSRINLLQPGQGTYMDGTNVQLVRPEMP